MKSIDFGTDFHWGVATAAYQTEGAYLSDGKGKSIWDVFTNTPGNVMGGEHANEACDFYHRYGSDLQLARQLHIPNFRFSLSWSRIFPEGTGSPNPEGVAYYHRLIDTCLEKGIEPWITLYHWDLPYSLHEKGGWTNREIIEWFGEYVTFCAQEFGDKVKKWIVLNEPVVFTGGGYFLGVHAPGIKKFSSYLKAVHHAAMCQAEGGRILRKHLPETAQIGTTFSCSHVEPHDPNSKRDRKAATKVDAILNRLFLEPALGLGYPTERIPLLKKIKKYMLPGDEEKLAFHFDFIGLQNYTREVVKHSWWTPLIHAKLIEPAKRGIDETTLMGWEVYPQAMYEMIKQFSSYENAPQIIITENGAAFPDELVNGRVHDYKRQQYIQANIEQVLRAKNEGMGVGGYLIWTFTDNFEWAEGYTPRFGIVHIDFDTQQRTVKDSGYWFRDFISGKPEALNEKEKASQEIS